MFPIFVIFTLSVFIFCDSRDERSVLIGIGLTVAAIGRAKITYAVDVNRVLRVILLLLKIFVDDAFHIVVFLGAIEVYLVVI